MNDLISKSVLKATIDEGWNDGLFKTSFFEEIESVPTIDAVPVVRCKDCKHNYGKEHCEEFNPEDIVCDYWDTDGLNEYDFCSRGDRSE